MIWAFRFLVFLGSVIVLGLFFVLLAPYFIDWDQFTDEFETQTTRILGQPVDVGGRPNLRILPFPHLSFENLSIGANADGSPLMTVERFSITAELLPLLSGDVKIVEMAMHRPHVDLQIEDDGTIAWTNPEQFPVNPEQVNIEKLTVSKGSISVSGLTGGRDLQVTDIQASLSAQSILGPWRIDANAEIDSEPVLLKIATGTYQQNEQSLRLRVDAVRKDLPYRLQVDGPASLADEVLSWKGDMTVSPLSSDKIAEMLRPVDPLPFQLDGKFEASPRHVSVPEYNLELGDRDDPYSVKGFGYVKIDESVYFEIHADGRQIDLERLQSDSESETKNTLQSRLSNLRSILDRVPVPNSRGEIKVNLPAIVSGDTYIRDIQALISPEDRGWKLKDFSANLPGNTRMEANGKVGLDNEFGFAGNLLLASRQPSGFAAWISGQVAPEIRRLNTFGFKTELTVSREQASFENLEMRLDDAVLFGSLRRLESADQRPTLVAELNGNHIDFDKLRALYSLTRSNGEEQLVSHNLDMKIEAQTVEARFEEHPVAAGDVKSHILIRDGNVTIEELNIGSFYGSSVSSVGRIENVLKNPEGNFRLDVSADSGSNLLKFIEQVVAPNPILTSLARSPDLTKHTNLSIELDARNVDGRSTGKLLVNGVSGGTDIASTTAFTGDVESLDALGIQSDIVLTNPTPSGLINQLGVDTIPIEELVEFGDPLRLDVSLDGTIQEGFQSRFSGVAGQSSASAQGLINLNDGFQGQLAIQVGSDNIAPYVLLTGAKLPGLHLESNVPVSMEFSFVAEEVGKTQFKDIVGQINGNPAAGWIVLETMDVQRPRVDGEIELSSLSLPLLANAVLDLGGGSLESDIKSGSFGSPMFAGWDADIAVKAKQATTGMDIVANDLKTKIVMIDGALNLNDIEMNVLNGTFSGRSELSNAGGTALVKLQYDFNNLDAGALLPKFKIAPVVEGKLSIKGTAESSARSLDGLISSVSGDGIFEIQNIQINGIDPGSFQTILLETDVDGFEFNSDRVMELVDDVILENGFAFSSIESPFSINSGQTRIKNLIHETEDVRLNAGFGYNLAVDDLSSQITLSFKPGRREEVEGADPQVSISWKGSPVALERSIDATLLEGYLALRAYENSQRRVETLEARVIEKQRMIREITYLYNRELHTVRKKEEAKRRKEVLKIEERKRSQEAVRLFLDNRLRLTEEARRREEARLKAEEEARLQEEARIKAEKEALRLEAEKKAAAEAARLKAEAQAKREAEQKRAAEQALQLQSSREARQLNRANQATQDVNQSEINNEGVSPNIRDQVIRGIEKFLTQP